MPRTRRSASAVLVEREESTLAWNWIDYISLGRDRRGRFTVLAKKYGEDPDKGGHRRWFTLANTKELKAPSEIRAALENAAEELGFEIVWRDVIPKIASVDWVVAAVIAHTTESDLPPLPDADTLLEQRSLTALGRVTIGVEWGYDMHDLTVSLEEWIGIANGEDFGTEEPYWYEGKKFTGSWGFGERNLEVGYDDGGVGWIGDIASVHALDGPKVEGVDIAHLVRAAGVLFFPQDAAHRLGLNKRDQFVVDDEGTLSIANFPEARTRADFYEDDIGQWKKSPGDLESAMDGCEPLAWAVHKIYSEVRDQLDEDLDEAESAEKPDKRKVAALKAHLASMPEEPYDGVTDWLESLSSKDFKASIVPRISRWLSEEPDWIHEADHLPEVKTAQGAALSYFQEMDQEKLDVLGVEVIEGEHPGSSYYAAKLRSEIEVANAAAVATGLPVRFVRPQ